MFIRKNENINSDKNIVTKNDEIKGNINILNINEEYKNGTRMMKRNYILKMLSFNKFNKFNKYIKLNKRKYFYIFSSIGCYYLYKKSLRNEYENIRNINDIENIKKIKIHNIISYVPLFIINVYDNYLYNNKLVKKYYYKYNNWKNNKKNNIKDVLKKDKININFINYEKNIFNKFYFYELILEKSIKYAILSPNLSLHIFRNVSEHLVNKNTKMYNEKCFNKKNEQNENLNIMNRLKSFYEYLFYNENEKKKKKKKKKKNDKNLNIYEKYNIHKYIKIDKNTETNLLNEEEFISINFLYLLNQAYDNVNRICVNINTLLLVNFYVINILKYIAINNYKNILVNHYQFEKINNFNNMKKKKFLNFFKFNYQKIQEFEEIIENDKNIQENIINDKNKIDINIDNKCKENINNLNEIKQNLNEINNFKDENEKIINNNKIENDKIINKIKEKKQNLFSYFKNKYITNIKKDDTISCDNNNILINNKLIENKIFLKELKILNDMYLILYIRLLLESSLKIINIKKNLNILEKKKKFDEENKIIYINTSDAINNLKNNLLKRFKHNKIDFFFNNFNGLKNNIIEKNNEIETKGLGLKVTSNELNENNTNLIEKKKSILLSSNINTFKKENENDNIILKYINKFTNYELFIKWKNSIVNMFSLYVNNIENYFSLKSNNMKQQVNYYVNNFDEITINTYQNILHNLNVNKIITHLNKTKENNYDLKKYKDIYLSTITNLNQIVSYIYINDKYKFTNKILNYYINNNLYEYNRLNEKHNMNYINFAKQYIQYLSTKWFNSIDFITNENYIKQENNKTSDKNYKDIKNANAIDKKLKKNIISDNIYIKNNIYFLLFIYGQRIRNCFYLFQYIYLKNKFQKKSNINYLYYKLYFLIKPIQSQRNILNLKYFISNNLLNTFTFLYFITSSYYFLFLVIYQLFNFSSHINYLKVFIQHINNINFHNLVYFLKYSII